MTTASYSAEQLAIRQQENSMISPERLSPAANKQDLYSHYWPPVASFDGLSDDLARFLALPGPDRTDALATLRCDPEEHGKVLHEYLSVIYSYLFGYRDGPCSAVTDDDLETAILAGKITLERELVDHWLTPGPVPEFSNQLDAADYLDELAESNPGVTHPLFDFLRDKATADQVARFLQCEVVRNEVVDDEVALLVTGMQEPRESVGRMRPRAAGELSYLLVARTSPGDRRVGKPGRVQDGIPLVRADYIQCLRRPADTTRAQADGLRLLPGDRELGGAAFQADSRRHGAARYHR